MPAKGREMGTWSDSLEKMEIARVSNRNLAIAATEFIAGRSG